jgi:hypothetical protein
MPAADGVPRAYALVGETGRAIGRVLSTIVNNYSRLGGASCGRHGAGGPRHSPYPPNPCVSQGFD